MERKETELVILDGFIRKIYEPQFLYSSSNTRKKEYDLVQVDILVLYRHAMEDRDLYLKTHINEIVTKAIQKIGMTDFFKQKEKSTESLKVYKATFIKSISMLQIIFSL